MSPTLPVPSRSWWSRSKSSEHPSSPGHKEKETQAAQLPPPQPRFLRPHRSLASLAPNDDQRHALPPLHTLPKRPSTTKFNFAAALGLKPSSSSSSSSSASKKPTTAASSIPPLRVPAPPLPTQPAPTHFSRRPSAATATKSFGSTVDEPEPRTPSDVDLYTAPRGSMYTLSDADPFASAAGSLSSTPVPPLPMTHSLDPNRLSAHSDREKRFAQQARDRASYASAGSSSSALSGSMSRDTHMSSGSSARSPRTYHTPMTSPNSSTLLSPSSPPDSALSSHLQLPMPQNTKSGSVLTLTDVNRRSEPDASRLSPTTPGAAAAAAASSSSSPPARRRGMTESAAVSPHYMILGRAGATHFLPPPPMSSGSSSAATSRRASPTTPGAQSQPPTPVLLIRQASASKLHLVMPPAAPPVHALPAPPKDDSPPGESDEDVNDEEYDEDEDEDDDARSQSSRLSFASVSSLDSHRHIVDAFSALAETWASPEHRARERGMEVASSISGGTRSRKASSSRKTDVVVVEAARRGPSKPTRRQHSPSPPPRGVRRSFSHQSFVKPCVRGGGSSSGKPSGSATGPSPSPAGGSTPPMCSPSNEYLPPAMAPPTVPPPPAPATWHGSSVTKSPKKQRSFQHLRMPIPPLPSALRPSTANSYIAGASPGPAIVDTRYAAAHQRPSVISGVLMGDSECYLQQGMPMFRRNSAQQHQQALSPVASSSSSSVHKDAGAREPQPPVAAPRKRLFSGPTMRRTSNLSGYDDARSVFSMPESPTRRDMFGPSSSASLYTQGEISITAAPDDRSWDVVDYLGASHQSPRSPAPSVKGAGGAGAPWGVGQHILSPEEMAEMQARVEAETMGIDYFASSASSPVAERGAGGSRGRGASFASARSDYTDASSSVVSPRRSNARPATSGGYGPAPTTSLLAPQRSASMLHHHPAGRPAPLALRPSTASGSPPTSPAARASFPAPPSPARGLPPPPSRKRPGTATSRPGTANTTFTSRPSTASHDVHTVTEPASTSPSTPPSAAMLSSRLSILDHRASVLVPLAALAPPPSRRNLRQRGETLSSTTTTTTLMTMPISPSARSPVSPIARSRSGSSTATATLTQDRRVSLARKPSFLDISGEDALGALAEALERVGPASGRDAQAEVEDSFLDLDMGRRSGDTVRSGEEGW